MEAKDLMIGDWVYNSKNEVCKVCSISQIFESNIMLDNYSKPNDGMFETELEFGVSPIPITREILEKNGFVYRKNSGAFIVNSEESYSNQTVEVTLFNVESEFRNNQLHICESNYPEETMLHLMECNYVHELQHVFRSCGIKKEIVL